MRVIGFRCGSSSSFLRWPRRVLELIRRGFQNKHIAVALKLAESTVKAHVTEILRKLKLFSRNKAVIEIGKIDLPAPKQQAARLERAKPT